MTPGQLDEIERRFLAHVLVRGWDDCWPWTGTPDRKGYGKITLRGVEFRAHRIAWQRMHGRDPSDLLVLHSCDNPPCCNPRHLKLGTHADNQREKRERGRSTRGEANPGGGKLTTDDVHEIRRRLAAGETGKRIAADYGVSSTLVYKIHRRQLWQHV